MDKESDIGVLAVVYDSYYLVPIFTRVVRRLSVPCKAGSADYPQLPLKINDSAVAIKHCELLHLLGNQEDKSIVRRIAIRRSLLPVEALN